MLSGLAAAIGAPVFVEKTSMCGITGIISKQVPASAVLKAMNDRLAHRGPDGEGFFLSSGIDRVGDLPGLIAFNPKLEPFVALGHRRLAIVDLSPAGHQPMVLNDRYVITYNGEVYNHTELRVELESLGYPFFSHSDTEVILAAYDAWGTDCLGRFNGMWAFAIVDTKTGRIFIARDRFGIKPLHYYQRDGKFLFASEIKAIVVHPEVVTAPDADYCRDYLVHGCNVEGFRTGFENINRFPPASFVECGIGELLDAPLHPKVYWDVHPNLSNEPFNEAKAERLAKEYYALLEDAVRLRLRADVKVGSALSGGLDSSSIVYLVNKLLREQGCEDQQETFSCVYKTPGTESCDESKYIDRLASALCVRSNQIEPRVEDIPAEHEKMIYAMDHPPESTCMSGWHTFMRVASSDVTVTLDGQGADEQLAGYLGYLFFWFCQMPLGQAFAELPMVLSIPGASKKVIPGLIVNLSRLLIGRRGARFLLRKLGYNRDPFVPLNEILLRDTQSNLLTLIHYSDRVSMAFSIESRMPFMDYRIVEYLASVPVAYKLHGGWTKYLARKAFAGKLPDEIVWRKDKMGWPIPEEHWFGGALKSWMESQVGNQHFIAWMAPIVNELQSEGVELGTLACRVRILNLSMWLSHFFTISSAVPGGKVQA